MKTIDKVTIAALAKKADIFLGASIILASNVWFSFDTSFTTFLHISMFLLILYFTINIGIIHYKIFINLKNTDNTYQKGLEKFILNIILLVLSILTSFLFVNNREVHNYTISLWLFVPLIISLPLFITHARVTNPNNPE